MYDPPQGRVADVERRLQVLALLRMHETGVRRSMLLEKVDEYRGDRTAVPVDEGRPRERALEALDAKVRRDLEALQLLGFGIEDLASTGLESVFVLRPTPWRVPLDLDDHERALLAWVMQASTGAEPPAVGEAIDPRSYEGVLGQLPHGLGLVHVALAGARGLVVEVNGEEKVVEPVQLASYQGRWSLLVRFPGAERVYGYRLDRLDVLRVGEPLPMPPQRVDPLEVLDPTAWAKHDPLGVELRCDTRDRELVTSWFPRAACAASGDGTVLTFSTTNLEAVLDRVIGLAGAARLAAPAKAVEQLRVRLTDVVQAAP